VGSLINLKGRRFFRLTVLKRVSNDRHGQTRWKCKCICGNYTIVNSSALREENTRSCGCLRIELVYNRPKLPNQLERRILAQARMRAKRDGVPFTITLKDIVIPKRCPVFGTLIKKGDKSRENSPSLDRKQNNLGYVPGNVFIISCRANRIKNDSTPEELRAVLSYVGRI